MVGLNRPALDRQDNVTRFRGASRPNRQRAGVPASWGRIVEPQRYWREKQHASQARVFELVARFGPTRETETAPLTRANGHSDVLINPVWCRPCMLRECPIDHRCMTGIEPGHVLAAIDRIARAVA